MNYQIKGRLHREMSVVIVLRKRKYFFLFFFKHG